MTASPEEGDVKLWLVSMGIVKSEEEATDLLTNHLEPEDTMEKLLLSCKAVNQVSGVQTEQRFSQCSAFWLEEGAASAHPCATAVERGHLPTMLRPSPHAHPRPNHPSNH